MAKPLTLNQKTEKDLLVRSQPPLPYFILPRGDLWDGAIVDKYTKEELADIVATSCSIREVISKLGYTTTHGNNYKTVWERINRYDISTEHFTFFNPSGPKTDEEIFSEHSMVAQSTLRRRYFQGNFSEYKCSICGQEPVWNDKELVLTLDHRNGINNDNRLENLRWVCPNCDRQLPTFGARNLKRAEDAHHRVAEIFYCQDCGIEISSNGTYCMQCHAIHSRKVVERPDKDKLFQMLTDNNGNFTQVGRQYLVNDNTVRKWCKSYDLPYHSSDYRPPKKIKEKQKVFQLRVAQIDKNTDAIVAEFDSVRQAEEITGISHVYEACDENNTKRKTAGGYKWKIISKTPLN